MTHSRLRLAVLSLAGSLLLAAAAQAQQKAPEAPAAKAPAAKSKSACNQITDEAKCRADTTCSWIAALTDSKTGKQKRKAYCKTKPKPPAKKAKDAGKT
jgi:hypothetical protein